MEKTEDTVLALGASRLLDDIGHHYEAEAVSQIAARLSQLEAQLADEKSACWSQTAKLEAQLREREEECVAHDEMNGVLAAILGNDDTLDEVAFRMRTRAESAEAALADAQAENERIKSWCKRMREVASGYLGSEHKSHCIDAICVLGNELAAAREENERLRKAWSEAEKEWRPHCFPDENCPTYYDGCHCSPATAAHFAEENERLESELAALKSRSEGRVERAAAVMIKYEMKIPAKFKGLTWEVLARAVLAAADREGE